MTELETALRDGLHDRLDEVDLAPGALAAVPARAARIRRRRAAVLAGVTSVALLAGISAAAYLPRGGRDTSSVDVVDDGIGRPAQSELSRRAEGYARQLAAGDYAGVRAEMTDKAREFLTETRLRNVWRSAFGDERADHFGVGSESRTGDRSVVDVLVQSPTRPGGTLYVVFDDDRRISGLLLVAPSGFSETWEPAVVRARELVSQLDDGAFAAVRRDFDQTMLAGLSEQRLATTWQRLVDVYGPLESTGGHLAALAPSGHRVVDVIVHLRDGVMKVRVAFGPEQRIAGLFVLVLDA